LDKTMKSKEETDISKQVFCPSLHQIKEKNGTGRGKVHQISLIYSDEGLLTKPFYKISS